MFQKKKICACTHQLNKTSIFSEQITIKKNLVVVPNFLFHNIYIKYKMSVLFHFDIGSLSLLKIDSLGFTSIIMFSKIKPSLSGTCTALYHADLSTN